VLIKIFKALVRLIKIAIGIGLIVLFLPRLITSIYSSPRLYKIESTPSKPVAIVFGAGLWRDGTPATVLRDRITTAAELYFSGKVQKLLMSGDNRFIYYNEPGAMREYAITLGVPDSAIVVDYGGRRTYDTCYRAKAIFGIQKAILVTQKFHIPRAIYTCNSLGVDAIGVPSDRRDYRFGSLLYWNLRELPATLTAFLDIHITHPEPVLGKPEPIFPDGTK
jgi:SanA protein